MDGLEKLDQSHAIFSGFDSAWKRIIAFFGTLWFAHFVGGNIYAAPQFVENVRANGLDALTDLRPFDLAWLPVEWLGTIFESFGHIGTFLYIAILAFAFLATMRGEDLPRWVFFTIIVGQPIDTFYIASYGSRLSAADRHFAGIVLWVYVALAIGGFYAWWRLREDHEEWVAPPPPPAASAPPTWPEGKDMRDE